ncbi:hypothetical protein DBR40_07435 [Pedobacter sp. KBW01]|uniref:nSTAND3 domain-containing NTPase n=1 Tax=Pedobacter sp. KBW01 TaxID=2153364 RepID=UPI000F5B1422|nr:restriction endonuclease [Pedobacter sp. KBW01]RQO77799.1 hypothetical protein DBR40_07435 [Pedobacter sp. KBW01]
MLDYDFLNLSPIEFEVLTRDVLQLHLGVQLESFGQGKDSGIDLRYAKGSGLVIQCKRYTDFSVLLQALKKEIKTVEKLAPKRYILVTSVSMLPERKRKIAELFSPYILGPEDIFGREDLNNLLTQYPQVEKANFKLWLSSTTVLEKILGSQIINQSSFALEDIRSKVNIYVQNDSFPEASKILAENRYVIISGIPGIGKTTLAEVLVFDALARGYEEFIYLSEGIAEGFRSYREGRKQIFLFDDFLGSNFLERNIGTNEEKQILKFIARIQQAPDKLLIFTTREYILMQASVIFEKFDQVAFVKTILDLSKYTTMVRARILYNHLFFHQIPYAYISEIIRQDYLMSFINHDNYNPRIIEYVANSRLWEKYSPKEFPTAMLEVFESPFKVWEHAFEYQISEECRAVLLCLLIADTSPEYEQVFSQVQIYTEKFSKNGKMSRSEFKRAIKELDNSFIMVHRNKETVFLRFHNPSINDFLVAYLQADEHIQIQLISAGQQLRAMVEFFSTKGSFSKNRLNVSDNVKAVLETRIIRDFDVLLAPRTFYFDKEIHADNFVASKLNWMNLHLKYEKGDRVYHFIRETIRPLLYSEHIHNDSLNEFARVISDVFDEHDAIDLALILDNLTPLIGYEEDLAVLKNLEDAFPDAFAKYREADEDAYQQIFEPIIEEKTDTSSEDIEFLKDKIAELQELANSYEIYVGEAVYELEKRIEKLQYEQERRKDDEYYDDYPEGFDYKYNYADFKTYAARRDVSASPVRGMSESDQIENMFRSLE